MASFYERAQNLFDDHQDRQATIAVANQRTQALNETRDALLGTALSALHDYRNELAVAAGPQASKEIHAKYAARFEGINDAFTVLRQAEPGITTKIDGEQMRRNAENHVEQQQRFRAYEESLARTRNEQSHSLSRGSAGPEFSY